MLKRTWNYLFWLVAALLLVVAPAAAQGDGSYPLAAITDGYVMLYGFGDGPQQVTQEPAQNTLDLEWSPNGEYLAFTQWDANYRLGLWLSGRDARPPIQVASGLMAGLPISFTADNHLIYAVDTGQFSQEPAAGVPGGGVVVEAYRLDPGANAEPQAIGSFVYGAGCGGGSSIPADWRYWAEAGTGPGIAANVLALTPSGLVHSTACMGRGVALLNLKTGEDVLLHETLGGVVVSPDGARVAGTGPEGQVMVVDLATGDVTAFSAAPGVDLLAWAADGQSLFYSTRQQTGESLPASAEEQEQLAQALGMIEPSAAQMPVMSVSLNQLDLASGESTTRYVAEAYAIGRIVPTPDGQTVLFSQIPNLHDWVAQVLNNTIDPMMDVGQQQLASVPVTLFALNLADDSVAGVGIDLNQAALNPAAYAEG